MILWNCLLFCSSCLLVNGAMSPCPAGYYCPAGSETAQLCPPGHFCLPQSSKPSICPSGFTCPGKNASASEIWQKLVSYGGWSFFKIPVSATLDKDILNACKTSGLVIPCAGASGCEYNDGTCVVTSELGCGNPMRSTAKKLGCSTGARGCTALDGVFAYMAGLIGGACGVQNNTYCVTGTSKKSGFALCAQKQEVMLTVGAGMKVPCPSGYFCPEQAGRPLICPAGYFCPAGSSRAKPCPAGYFCSGDSQISKAVENGASRTVLCPTGHYCPEGKNEAIICPGGTVCSEGIATPKPCPAGYMCPAGSPDERPEPVHDESTEQSKWPTWVVEWMGQNSGTKLLQEQLSQAGARVRALEAQASSRAFDNEKDLRRLRELDAQHRYNISELATQVEQASAELLSKASETNQLRQQLSQADARVRSLESQASLNSVSHEKDLRRLSESGEQQKYKISELANQVEQATVELLSKAAEIKRLQQQISEAHARVRELELQASSRSVNHVEELRRMRESGEQQERRISELVVQVEQASAELLDKDSEIELLRRQLSQTDARMPEAELETSSRPVNDLEVLQRLRESVDQQKRRISEMAAQLDDKTQGIIECKAELRKSMEALNSSEAEQSDKFCQDFSVSVFDHVMPYIEKMSAWPRLLLFLVTGLAWSAGTAHMRLRQPTKTMSHSSQIQHKLENVSCRQLANKGAQSTNLADVVMQEQAIDKNTKNIHIICPGAQRACIEALPNGVRVSVEQVMCPNTTGALEDCTVEKEFTYDHAVDGWFEPCHEECSLDCGVLKLVLKRKPPQRMTLRSDASGFLQYSALSVNTKARSPSDRMTPANSSKGQERLPPEVHCMAGVSSEGTLSVTSLQWNMIGAGTRSHVSATPAGNREADAISNCSQSSVKCYLPNTAFKRPDGHLALVQTLEEGSIVLLSDGREARVVSKKLYTPQRKPYNLIELVTTQGSFRVSARHLVAVPDGPDGHLKGKCAEELQVGDNIVVGSKERALTKVIPAKARTELYMISFSPDAPVEAFPVSTWGIQTYGEPQSSHDGFDQCGKDLLQLVGLAEVSELDLQMAMPTEYED